MARVYERDVVYDSVGSVSGTFEGARVSWGGVWSGFLFGMGLLILFSALGLAIGISAADLSLGGDLDARGLGIGAAIWSGLSLLVALFVGGMVATRCGMVFDRTTGMIEGALVWVLAMLGIIYLAGSGISLVGSSALGLLSGATRQVGAVVRGVPQLDDLASGDINQVQARLSDPETVRMVAAATGMSEQEARARLTDIRARMEAVREDPAKAAAEARQGLNELRAQAGRRAASAAAAAQPYASAAAWTTFAFLVLSLLAAIAGALVGARRAAARVGAE